MLGGCPPMKYDGASHCGKRNWSTMTTRMFGCVWPTRGGRRAAEPTVFSASEASDAPATARIATPAPPSRPPASSPPLRKVRRLSLLLCSGSMSSIRALILWAVSAALALALPTGPAIAAQTGPACVPSTLNTPAVVAGAVTISPAPGSRDASPGTQISFLGVSAARLSRLSVVGTATGRHSGRLAAYSQGDGASFLPAAPFSEGERVTVRALVRVGRSNRALSDTFAIAHQDSISSTPETIHPGTPAEAQSFHSRPDLHPPVVAVGAHSPSGAAGDEFVAPYTGPGQAGPMILDPNGAVVWFKPLPTGVSATNFRVQEYEGRPVLTWWQGDISVHGFGLGTDVILDSSYAKVGQVKAGNGLQADLHEFQLTTRGTALITAFDPIQCDLSSVHGLADGAATDGVFQEIDVKTGLVRFQWTSLDHVALGESYESRNGSLSEPYDFFHINSLNADADGGILVSARNTWTVYDVDGRTGQIDWRLGGKNSSFHEGSESRTAWQHDPRELPDGTLSIFDNGSSPTVHPQSRGVVLRLDGQSRTATLVSQFTHVPGLIAESQGNLQALANGDWFIGWGQDPHFSELGPQGQLLFDARFPAHTQSYRSFRFAWTGTPAHRPSFSLQPGPPGAGTVFASWNGATQVASWRVLAGATPASMTTVAEASRSGFETGIPLPPGAQGSDVAVEALDASGATLGVSAPVAESGMAPAG